MAQNLNFAQPAPMPALYKRELPDSQDSYVSAASSTFSAPQLPSSSSNLSVSTVGDTDLVNSSTLIAPPEQAQCTERAKPESPKRVRRLDAPLRVDAVPAPRTGDTAASPMSLDSPVAQGFKRSADGAVKGSTTTADTSAKPASGHKRPKSMDAGRIGELSAQLKTRLSYAMVKVQNGWEKQSLEELEERTSQQGSPLSATSRSNGSRPTFDSPIIPERRRRPSGVSDNSEHMMISPGQSTPSDLSRSHANTPSSFWRHGAKPTMNAAVNLISVTGSDAGGMLRPAAEFSSRRNRRSSASNHPPPLLGSDPRKHYSDLSAMATPRTPATPRPGILRMPSQQAEKDAVDTLLFMSSPNNSGRLPHTSMDAHGQRTHVAPPQRRVMFEANLGGEGGFKHPQQPQAPSSQPAAYYRVERSR